MRDPGFEGHLAAVGVSLKDLPIYSWSHLDPENKINIPSIYCRSFGGRWGWIGAVNKSQRSLQWTVSLHSQTLERFGEGRQVCSAGAPRVWTPFPSVPPRPNVFRAQSACMCVSVRMRACARECVCVPESLGEWRLIH